MRSRGRGRVWWSVLGSLGVVGGFLLDAPLASASREIPGKLRKALDAPCAPSCMLCHSSPDGGKETVRQNVPAITYYATALSGTPAPLEGMDTDNDLVSDIEELRTNRNPWMYGDAPVCVPEYGCGARIAEHPPSESGHTTEFLIGASVALVLVQRRFPRS